MRYKSYQIKELQRQIDKLAAENRELRNRATATDERLTELTQELHKRLVFLEG